MRVRRMVLIALAPALFGSAACGSGRGTEGPGVAGANGGKATPGASSSASPGRSLDPRDAQLAFAQCMREHGVNMADPEPGDDRVRITAGKGEGKNAERAMEECRHHLEAGGRLARPDDPKVRDRMLKFAQCMREHGVDVPDPEPGRGIQLRMDKGSEARVEAAQKACEQYAPGKAGAK